MVDIFAARGQQPRGFNQVFTALPYLKMLINSFPLAIKFQRMRNISRKDEPPMHPILEVELFDFWGIDFMGPFPSAYNNLYILLDVDYVSKWVKAIPTHTNDAKIVAQFLRSHIFSRFGTPRALITDNGTHFCNKVIDKVLQKYGVGHRTYLAYHPK